MAVDVGVSPPDPRPDLGCGMIDAMTGSGERELHLLRILVALAMVIAFLTTVAVSLVTGREPPLIMAAPTMFVLAWLYRAAKAGENGT